MHKQLNELFESMTRTDSHMREGLWMQFFLVRMRKNSINIVTNSIGAMHLMTLSKTYALSPGTWIGRNYLLMNWRSTWSLAILTAPKTVRMYNKKLLLNFSFSPFSLFYHLKRYIKVKTQNRWPVISVRYGFRILVYCTSIDKRGHHKVPVVREKPIQPMVTNEGCIYCNDCGKQFTGLMNLKQHFAHPILVIKVRLIIFHWLFLIIRHN